jgi:hypothetical protein
MIRLTRRARGEAAGPSPPLFDDATPAPARRGIFVGALFLGGCGVPVVLTIVTGVVIVAEVRSAGQGQQHRRRDADEQHASESEADGDGGERQPDALKPVFNHGFLGPRRKTPPGSQIGAERARRRPRCDDRRREEQRIVILAPPGVKPPWRKVSGEREK